MAAWPHDPYGDMAPILEQSIEAVKARHPSGKAPPMAILTAYDRCDNCSAAAQFRVQIELVDPDAWHVGIDGDLVPVTPPTLDFCGHHWQKHHAILYAAGWYVVAGTKLAMEEAHAALDGVS